VLPCSVSSNVPYPAKNKNIVLDVSGKAEDDGQETGKDGTHHKECLPLCGSRYSSSVCHILVFAGIAFMRTSPFCH
jgi:hypothetical protein